MEIYNLKDRLEYLNEVSELEYDEWADEKEINRNERLKKKKNKIKELLPNKSFCKLILVNNGELVGFISILMIIMGIVVLINPFSSFMLITKLIGIFTVCYGLFEAMYISLFKKRAKNLLKIFE